MWTVLVSSMSSKASMLSAQTSVERSIFPCIGIHTANSCNGVHMGACSLNG